MTFWTRFTFALLGAACIGAHVGSVLVFWGVFWVAVAVAPKD